MTATAAIYLRSLALLSVNCAYFKSLNMKLIAPSLALIIDNSLLGFIGLLET